MFVAEALYMYMEKEDVFALQKGVFDLKKGASAMALFPKNEAVFAFDK